MQIFYRGLSTLLTFLIYCSFWLLNGGTSFVDTTPLMEVGYENLAVNCKRDTLGKRMEQFKNSETETCDKTRLALKLQTEVQHAICSVHKELKDQDKKHNSHHHHHHQNITYKNLNKHIFGMMAINLNHLTRLQQNYVQAQSFYKVRKEKLKKLENLILELKEQIIKNLLHNARCEKFQHDCKYLNMGSENPHNNDTNSHARFIARFKTVLSHYKKDLIESLRLIYFYTGNNDLPENIINTC